MLQIFKSSLILLLEFLFVTFSVVMAVDSDCNYLQQLQPGPIYYVYNKEYPNYYGQRKNCLWAANAPDGYRIQVKCSLEMPSTNGCVDDRLLISLEGHTPTVQNSVVLCGFGNRTLESVDHNISIALQTSYRSKGGKFLCTLEAKPQKESNCNCGWKNMRRIVGGTETSRNEYPMMAALMNSVRHDIFCGATIISQKYALSAAHCWKTNDDVTTIVLLVGEHNTSTAFETNATKQYKIKDIILHPDFNGSGEGDIAVVETLNKIDFNARVGPACLPFAYYQYSFAGQEVTALGWGTTEFTGPKSEVLLETDVNVLSYQDCSNLAAGSINTICTYRSGHDACQSDSGGPILWMNQDLNKLYLIGIISNGYGCASTKPGLNTRVSSYLMWILSVTPDVCYCTKGPENY